ncbi:MAG: hypothetical protein IAC55_07085 [Tyzzerella sp.]|uniref:Uncharacterized protein n=1 Tax=Candidatus Fimicola merdigallinarum TaxID=2840819 RepID=A0A9D9H3G3_9FIRM|nr:hypothetical protein [Candidatus Fimicola merdigallinarum]
MILNLLNICTKKKELIRDSIEEAKNFYMDRVFKIKNSFYMNFFEFSIESTEVDIYEYFVEAECENNFFYDNIFLMDRERGRRFFKVMAIHNAIRVLKKNGDIIDKKHMEKYLFYTFMFNSAEKKVYELLYKCINEYEGEFQRLFSITIAKYVFQRDKLSPFALAFIENFCYNSFNEFYNSFTKYISMNRRLERAVE